MALPTAASQDFQRFKAVCVPILGSAKLTPTTIPTVSSLLSSLLQLLRDTDPASLNGSLIMYIFFPLKSIFERNSEAEIPDQVLEKLLLCLSVLCDAWWWTCDLEIWKQIFILCGSIIGGLEGKGKARARDDETKAAGVQCMISLMRQRTAKDAAVMGKTEKDAIDRYFQIQQFASSREFVSITGQTLDYILASVLSSQLSLQQLSLKLLFTIIDAYAPEDMLPTVLPGIASCMTKVCLGPPGNSGWTNGDIVASALKVLQVSIAKAIGDEVCVRAGVLLQFSNLEELASFGQSDEAESQSTKSSPRPMLVKRTQAWLRATASQLHIALNSLNPLSKHPTPSATYGLIEFSANVLSSTPSTLTQSQPLLLSFLLSAANSTYPKVALTAIASLKSLLSKPDVGTNLTQQLARITSDNLSALPRLLSSQSDARVQHVAEVILSVCKIGMAATEAPNLASISKFIAKLLGPAGGIEKWGWNLLSVLQFESPAVSMANTSSARLLLEETPQTLWTPFPDLVFRNISSHEARRAVEDMLRAMGRVVGDPCLFSIEWFIDVGRSSTQSRSVAAMWCACRLLEGVADIHLSSESSLNNLVRHSKRLEKQVRAFARSVAELWDKSDFHDLDESQSAPKGDHEELEIKVKYQKGLTPLDETLKIVKAAPVEEEKRILNQPMLHRGLCLQLIAIASGVLQSRFDSLSIFTLYPILHSIVSPTSFLSSSGSAALNYVTIATSYASPANLLLSNFDYALDSVSRRLTRRWLDIDATRVLVVLIRLVGRDVVDKAGDVVEECFDRLDAYHGYSVIVDGLIEVLSEVLHVIELDLEANPGSGPDREEDTSEKRPQLQDIGDLLDWLPKRHTLHEHDDADYGPAPREAWGKKSAENGEGDSDDEEAPAESQDTAEAPHTTSQQLTTQIISRSLYFLTHESPVIRARILSLLTLSIPILPNSALLPSIHSAWPFILNRFSDHETFVVSASASLVEALSIHVGSFMYRRIWDDIWPRFQKILKQLGTADSANALARRGPSAVGTESAYTHSHRLYKAIINTMMGVMKGVHPYEPSFWDTVILFRRFLGRNVHLELQEAATKLYFAAAEKDADAVWLALQGTTNELSPSLRFLVEERWGIEERSTGILGTVGPR